MHEKTLIALATAWGPKHGGINSFNRDLLRAFGVAFRDSVRVVCLVPRVNTAEKKEAHSSSVELRAMVNPPEGERLTADHAAEIVNSLKDLLTEEVLWLGHDSFTGAAAVEAAKQTGAKAAVIHHMSYAAYKGFQSGSSQKAEEKSREQREIFTQADYRLAVGPLLRDELQDLVDADDITMLIPGLPEIESSKQPNHWTVLLFGRLDPESDRIKQGRLGVAAFAMTYRDATEQPGLSPLLRDSPRLKLFGIEAAEETELRQFAGEKAGAALNLQVLPFEEDRNALFNVLSRASVALMPSWHEGFGLAGWEAIGAGIPLIMSKQSGLYKFLTDEMAGAGTKYAVDIRGREAEEPYQEQDVITLSNAMKQVAAEREAARRVALKLREILLGYTWANCAETLAAAFGWLRSDLPKVIGHPPSPPVQNQAPLGGLLFQPQPIWQAGKGFSDSMLLRAEEASVPFYFGREQTLNEVLDWARGTTNYPLAIRLHTGPGGVGKTRLLIEACERLGLQGWQTGFLESTLGISDIKRLLPGWLDQHEKTLMVVDYAESRGDQVAALVEFAQIPPGRLLRIVLLARSAGDWWDRMAMRSPKCEAIFTGYATSGPYPLPPLHDEIENREVAFHSAWQAFAERLDIKMEEPPLPDLSAAHYSSPLYLQMAALLSLHGEQADTARGLLDTLLRHEGHYWRRLGDDLGLREGERYALHLLTLSTLAGGITTTREALMLYQSSTGPVLGKVDLGRLFVALCPLYPGRQGLEPVRPDLLGESLVARALALAEDQGKSLLDTVLGNQSSESTRHHALTVLTRLAQHRPDMVAYLIDALCHHFRTLAAVIVAVGLETGEPLPAAAVIALDQLKPNERQQVVGMLSNYLPSETVKLAVLALKVAEYRCDYARNAYEKRSTLEHTRSYLKALSILGNCQAALGNYNEAQTSYTSSLQMLKKLPPGNNKLETEAGLNGNLSNVISEQGRLDEALESAQTAVALYDSLTKSNPNHYEAGLASSLNNLGSRLSDLGRYEEGLQYAQRAQAIYNRLAKNHPDRYEPDLARSLNNLGGRLSDVGRVDEGLQHAQRALAIRERLVQVSPDSHEPDLASSFNNLGAFLSDLGREEEGLQYAQRATDIYNHLAQIHPERYEALLAGSLNNMGSHLSALGRYEEGLQYVQRASDIYDRLAQIHPGRFESDLAGNLNNLGSRLSNVGRYEEGLQYTQRGLAIRERLAQIHPERYESDLGASLNSLANRLVDLGRYEEGVQNARHAHAIYNRLAQIYPERYESELAMSFNNLGTHLSDLGQYEEGLQNAQHAHAIYKRLAQAHPGRYESDLAMSLNNLGSHLSDLGQYEEGLQHAQYAHAIYKRLAQAHPGRYESDLAMSLNNLGSHLSNLGRYEEALDYRNKALSSYRDLAVRIPQRYSLDLFNIQLERASLFWVRRLHDSAMHSKQELEVIPSNVPAHLRPVLKAHRALVLGCLAHEMHPKECEEQMQKAESLYQSLPIPLRRLLQDTHVITSAYLANHHSTPEKRQAAQEVYEAYAMPRKGRLPSLMLDTLERLDCAQ